MEKVILEEKLQRIVKLYFQGCTVAEAIREVRNETIQAKKKNPCQRALIKTI